MPLSAWAFALFSAVLFGLAMNLAQRGIRHMEPALGSVISIPTAATLFWLSSPFTADFSGWRNDAALLFTVTGLFYPAAVTILTFEATRLLGPNITAALGNVSPAYAVAIGVFFLGEALGARQLIGVSVLIIGCMVLSTARRSGTTSWPLWAMALPLTASLLRGLGQPLLKIGFQWWPNPRVATLLCYAASAMVTVTVGLLRTRGTQARFTRKGVLWFMAVGLANGLATWSGIEAVALGPVSLVAPVVATYPLFTLLIGRVLIGKAALGSRQVAGVTMTVLGIVLLLAAG